MVLLALIGGGIAVTETSGGNSKNATAVTVISLPLQGYLGITKCIDGKPMVFLSDTLTGNNLTGTIIHEFRHVEQHKAYKSCEEMASMYAEDSHFRIKTEADAYCYELNALHQLGLDPPMGRLNAEMMILDGLHNLDSTVTFSEIQGYITHFCGG